MEMTEREKIVLSHIVQAFIDNAEPVSSKYLAQHAKLNLSPATIRNVMAQLEAKGLINQPHISAGRIPTTLGYRIYVNELMHRASLSSVEKNIIYKAIRNEANRIENLLESASRILANITHQLSVLIAPGLDDAVFKNLELIPLHSRRLLIVLSLQSGLIKTIDIEIREAINPNDIRKLSSLLNERLSGLTISTIRTRYTEILKGLPVDKYGILRLFMNNSEQLFRFDPENDLHYKGISHLLENPEFKDVDKLSGLVDIIEHKKPLVSLFEHMPNSKRVASVVIGDEIDVENLKDCSIVVAQYTYGNAPGRIGVIGPTRMHYNKLVAVVEFTAKAISNLSAKN